MRRTALSNVIDLTFPHAFAARETLRSLRFLHLNPDVLRQPSSINAPQTLSVHGGNLPRVLARMQAEDKFTLGGITLDLANLVPDLTTIELKEDKADYELLQPVNVIIDDAKIEKARGHHSRRHYSRHYNRKRKDLYEPLGQSIDLERLCGVPSYKQFVDDFAKVLKDLRLIR